MVAGAVDAVEAARAATVLPTPTSPVKETVVDAYLADYEEGKIDRDIVARRIDKVSDQIRRLRYRRDEDWPSRVLPGICTLEELEWRIAAVEERLGVESGLRASGDRDLADMAQTLRAQQHTIQALAITQSQHNEKLDRHERSLDEAHGKLDQIIAMLGRLLDDGDSNR